MTAVLTHGAVDRTKQHTAVRWYSTLTDVLHDQRPVPEDVDELAQMEQTHLLQMLPLLVRRGGTAREFGTGLII